MRRHRPPDAVDDPLPPEVRAILDAPGVIAFGVRNGEVVGLTADDEDWQADSFLPAAEEAAVPGAAEADTDRAHRERRKALLREIWPDLRLSPDDVMRRLNDLPGPARRLTTTASLYSLAKELGLPTARSVAYAPTSPATTDDAQADEDRREGFAMFDAGKSAREVAKEFGRLLSEVSAWKVAWNEQRAKGAPA